MGCAQEGRANTVVEVWARSEQCVARDGRSKLFGREWERRFPGVSA